MSILQSRTQVIADTATHWREADYPARQEAVEKTLKAPNRWTGPSLDHALNRWMQQLTVEALRRWLGDEEGAVEKTIAVVHGEEEPLSGFRDALAVWGMGGEYIGVVPEASPALLPAFANDVAAASNLSFRFFSVNAALEEADAVVAEPTDRIDSLEEKCERAGIPKSRRHLQSPRYSIGLIDGHESEDEMERLAEDMLLYEGQGHRRLGMLWAPQDHQPDSYLEAMARFRGLFPAHDDTPGTLQMQQAFLEAQDSAHAYADGLEFLMSRGAPEPQKAGHIRWTEYDDLGQVDEWWETKRNKIYAVVARHHLHEKCPDHWPVQAPGGVHFPPLDDVDGISTVQFLNTVGSSS